MGHDASFMDAAREEVFNTLQNQGGYQPTPAEPRVITPEQANKLLDACLFDMTTPPPSQDYMLEIDGVGVIPANGLVAITGKAKQGKTHFLAAMTATLLSGKSFGSMRRLKAPKHILWCDTEQSPSDIYNVINRMYRHAGIPTASPTDEHGLTVLQMRPLDAWQRASVIIAAVERYDPDVLIIDGLRDLLTNINSEEEATAVISWLLQTLSARPMMRIITVLHTNPSGAGDKMRGHIGTELENKLSDKFTCSKENGIFAVQHTSRGREIMNPFIFRIDINGNLATSTIEERNNVMNADEAFIASVPDTGAAWVDIVRTYAKLTGMTQARAKDAMKARLNSTPPALVKHDGLFWRNRRE